MQRNKDKTNKYASKKAQSFKDNYANDVKSAVNARRAKKEGRQLSKGTEEERAKIRQDRRRAERESGAKTGKQQRQSVRGSYGAGYRK